MLKEFKEFAMRGNVIDMAVGVVLGIAFGAIVKSLVDDVLMPPIAAIVGNVDFSHVVINLKEGVVVRIGAFINHVINFLIVAFAIFMVIRQMNKLKKAPPPADPTTKACPSCCTDIPIQASRCPNCTTELAEAA